MFSKNEGYPFCPRGSRKECDGDLYFRRHTFSFKSKSRQAYIVEVDEFEEFQLYVVKFYLKAHRYSKRKFQLLTKLNEPAGIITTCINIMAHFYEKNPYCSFGFIGMNSENETEYATKRYRVYQKVMCRLFSPVQFLHYEYRPKSAYLLLNRDYAETHSNLMPDIEQFFNKHYILS